LKCENHSGAKGDRERITPNEDKAKHAVTLGSMRGAPRGTTPARSASTIEIALRWNILHARRVAARLRWAWLLLKTWAVNRRTEEREHLNRYVNASD
jgi:hypothetical protein